ncbi:MAG: ROK family protein [Verrucomicrobiales bacterium]
MSFCAIGIDVGGTKIAAGLVQIGELESTGPVSGTMDTLTPAWRPLAKRTVPTGTARGGRAVLDDVLQLANESRAEANRRGLAPQAIGLGICELVTRDGRLASANCLDWLDLPVVAELSAIAPAVLEADVRAAAQAEAIFGAGRGKRHFLYVTVGTGISACLMIDGQPFLGAQGATGTMASSPIRIPCESCGACHTRSLEEIASGPALVARFRSRGGQAYGAEEVMAASAAGDVAAREIVTTAAEALGSQIGLLINMLDPEAVVIGGGLGLSGGLFWDGLRAAIHDHIWSPTRGGLPVLPAATGNDAGWLGAAAAGCLHLLK